MERKAFRLVLRMGGFDFCQLKACLSVRAHFRVIFVEALVRSSVVPLLCVLSAVVCTADFIILGGLHS